MTTLYIPSGPTPCLFYYYYSCKEKPLHELRTLKIIPLRCVDFVQIRFISGETNLFLNKTNREGPADKAYN